MALVMSKGIEPTKIIISFVSMATSWLSPCQRASCQKSTSSSLTCAGWQCPAMSSNGVWFVLAQNSILDDASASASARPLWRRLVWLLRGMGGQFVFGLTSESAMISFFTKMDFPLKIQSCFLKSRNGSWRTRTSTRRRIDSRFLSTATPIFARVAWLKPTHQR